MNKIKIAVVMGGKTPEHKISLISGQEVVRNLRNNKYTILPIVINSSGTKWQLISPDRLLKIPEHKLLKGAKKEIAKSSKRNLSGVEQIARRVDVVFIAMHGPFGEDGTIQGMFELVGVKYTGPGVLASALGMDKLMFRKVMKAVDIPYPRCVALKKNDSITKVGKELGSLPYFVKPHNQGSSVGCSIVNSRKQLNKALELAWKYSDTALVDEYLKGIEITCGVIGNENPAALPLVEIVPLKEQFFDYASKYTESGAEEIVPARVSKKTTSDIQRMAIKVFKELGCRGFSRVDFILVNKNAPIVLEINTIPGLTPMSLLPKAAKEAGYSYSTFLDKIINYAIK